MRTSTFELVTDTSHFTALQLQPAVLLRVSFNTLSRWLNEYLVSFPRLIREHRLSVVILAARIHYDEPLGFFDSDSLWVDGGCRVMGGGRRLCLDVEFSTGTAVAASVSIVLCPVVIEDPLSLGAAPTTLAGELLERFEPDEIDRAAPERTFPKLRRMVESEGTPLAEGSSPFVVHRHLCEVADQWAFTEVPAIVGASSEVLAVEGCAEQPELGDVLALPLRSFEMELTRPYYWFQAGQVVSRAYGHPAGLAVVHQLLSDVPGNPLHGLVIEQFRTADIQPDVRASAR